MTLYELYTSVSFFHIRFIVSKSGEPLHIQYPLTQYFKGIVRIVNCAKGRESSKPLFEKSKILEI